MTCFKFIFKKGWSKIKEKINTLKDKLNKELENKNLCDQEVIKISQELDQLILEYYYNNDNILPDNDNSSWFLRHFSI